MRKLCYVGQSVADDLKESVEKNLARYRDGDFCDLEASGNWRISLDRDMDVDGLAALKAATGADAEVANSMVVGKSLSALDPSLARENRIWVRLSHIECLNFSRLRWLSPGGSDDAHVKSIRKHFFASTLTSCRDDHAVARLWWNYWIASKIIPGEPEYVLRVILRRADIRLNFIERPGLSARPKLAREVVLTMAENEDLLRTESVFREFMKAINLQGAGRVFEALPSQSIRDFLRECLDAARGESRALA